MLGHLGDDHLVLASQGEVHLDRIEDLGQAVGRELDVDDRARHLDDPAYGFGITHSMAPSGSIGRVVTTPPKLRRHPRSR